MLLLHMVQGSGRRVPGHLFMKSHVSLVNHFVTCYNNPVTVLQGDSGRVRFAFGDSGTILMEYSRNILHCVCVFLKEPRHACLPFPFSFTFVFH